ncbi:MAG: hypothetical protein F4Z35_00995 [Dehalococcoidia bacterium]|nr:hypothetical protein [Dehalococcoidia bacterium]
MRVHNSLRWLVVTLSAAMLFAVASACGQAEAPPTPVPVDVAAIVQQAMEAQQPGVTADDMASAIQSALAAQPGVTTEDVAAEIAKALREQPGGVTSEEMAAAISSALAEQPGVTTEDVAAEIAKALRAQPGGVTEEQMTMAIETALKAQPGLSQEDIQMAVEAAVESAVAAAAPAPPDAMAMSEAQGTLNIGFKELWAFNNSPLSAEGNALVYVGNISSETLLKLNKDVEVIPQTITEWSVDDSGSVWTLKVREGVQFHKDWGELKAEDIVYTMLQSASPDTVNTQQNVMERLFAQEGGGPKVIDDYTIEVDTVTRQADFIYKLFIPEVMATVSKKMFQELGDEAAGPQGVGTGPWEFVEQRSGEYWKFEAVADHWRQPPDFAELMLRQIPEEATRVANFKTGKLDTFLMAFDSKRDLDELPDIRYMAVANGGSTHIGLHPNHYVGMGEADFEERRPGAFNCLKDNACPWVSPNPDLNSPEWERARKVREAMLIAIDYEEVVDTLLDGEGTPQSLWTWENRIRELNHEYRVRPFDPERAKQLLREAGYEDGFHIEVTASIRNIAAEEESCEAVAQYWNDIGITTKINRVPASTIIPIVQAREYVGLNCHGTGGKIDPVIILDAMVSNAGWSAGFDHPYLEDELVPKLEEVKSAAGHWIVMNEIAGFIYENALDGGFYSVNILWPLSPRVNSWIDGLQHGDPRSLGSYEYATHRN